MGEDEKQGKKPGQQVSRGIFMHGVGWCETTVRW
jgi:hypothetical protein